MAAPKFYSETGLPAANQRDVNGVYFLRTASGFKLYRVANTAQKDFVELEIDWSKVTGKPTEFTPAANSSYYVKTAGDTIYGSLDAKAPTEVWLSATEKSTGNYIRIYQQAGASYVIADKESGTPTQPLVIYAGGAEKMRIEANGNVGIGTASPNDKLEVNGNIRLSAPVPQIYTPGYINPLKIDASILSLQTLSGGELLIGGNVSVLGNVDCASLTVDGRVPATLDLYGKVPASQLPAYVDDVLEYANLAAFPATGETSKIYIALDTSKSYRWSGSAYVEIVASPGTTDNVPEGATNKYYTDARAIAACEGSFAPADHTHSIDEINGLESGTYEPDISLSSGITSIDASKFFFQRVGNIVSVSATFQIIPDAKATTEWVKVSLPIASDLEANSVNGTGFIYHPGTAYLNGIRADYSEDLIEVGIEFSRPGACQVNVSIMYQVK